MGRIPDNGEPLLRCRIGIATAKTAAFSIRIGNLARIKLEGETRIRLSPAGSESPPSLNSEIQHPDRNIIACTKGANRLSPTGGPGAATPSQIQTVELPALPVIMMIISNPTAS